jgi:hypothetical protein
MKNATERIIFAGFYPAHALRNSVFSQRLVTRDCFPDNCELIADSLVLLATASAADILNPHPFAKTAKGQGIHSSERSRVEWAGHPPILIESLLCAILLPRSLRQVAWGQKEFD